MILTTQQIPDALDALDKGLEFVQAICEHAAFQFLRKGDCNDKIVELKERLGKTADLAGKMIKQNLKEAYDVGNTP
ncbi:hypothetical protein MCOR25_011220 [Pyricularia grisea]|nr:hypothetical protein MCOR25_011220 [Pyricularia grisea]